MKSHILLNIFTGLYSATLLGGEFSNCYGHGKTEANAIASLKIRVAQLRRGDNKSVKPRFCKHNRID